MQTITLYGIPNCDSVKKARAWFTAHNINVQFHNFKTNGLTENILQHMCSKISWQTLLNKKGTTYRGLPSAEKDAIVDERSAVKVMLQFPSIIKRPVITFGEKIVVGFSEKEFEDHFLNTIK